MKLNRTNIFIAISSIALSIVLIIQVNWIFQTAKIKEEIFNEKANMVLSKTAEALSSDTVTCKNMETCIGKNEIHKTDSLFTNYMKFYNFHIDYSFEVKKPGSVTAKNESDSPDSHRETGLKNNVYKKRLEEEATKNGLELNLFLPEKKQFILEEMGTMFITSVILILVVLVMFWRTILLLMKEKKISEHTTDFLNNMTHEFKTPLTNIALAGKMIIKDSTTKQGDKIKHYSEIILEENEKLRLQVEQVLSMTALERGEIPLRKTELDFHELINDSLKYISIQIENKKGNLKLNLNADKFVVMGDKTHLTNALCNLMQLAFENLRAPSPGASPTDLVHYRAAEIDQQIDLLYNVGRDTTIAGSALIFSAERQEATRNILPTLTAAMNSLPAGLVQPPHRHNSVAVSLVIQGANCFSIIDGRRKNWSPWATTITPPVSVHSHHNDGNEQARFLIIQDGGIFYHARAMGFSFAEQPE